LNELASIERHRLSPSQSLRMPSNTILFTGCWFESSPKSHSPAGPF